MTATRVSYWTEQLQECEQQASPELSRATWLRRVYARLYRFLLARYGDAEFDEVTPAPMRLIDATDALDGKAARTSGEIQATLKHIHAAQPAERLQGGTSISLADAWVTVMDRHQRFNFEGCQRLLGTHGIPSRQLAQGKHRRLQVPRAYSEKAMTLVKEAREELRLPQHVLQARRRMTNLRTMLTCIALGMVLGLPVLGVMLIQVADLADLMDQSAIRGLIIGLLLVVGMLLFGIALSYLVYPLPAVAGSRLKRQRRRSRRQRAPRS